MKELLEMTLVELIGKIGNHIALISFETKELQSPSMMGEHGAFCNLEATEGMASIYLWNTGSFEVVSTLAFDENGDVFHRIYVPPGMHSKVDITNSIQLLNTMVDELCRSSDFLQSISMQVTNTLNSREINIADSPVLKTHLYLYFQSSLPASF